MSNQLQNPFSDIIGDKSPVQKLLKIAWHFADAKAAIMWKEGRLKSSDAAKIWTVNSNSDNTNSSKYRKTIRTSLNNYGHCTPEQANWNVHLETIANNSCKAELNTEPMVISINVYCINRCLCIHIFELMEVIKMVYMEYIKKHQDLENQISDLQNCRVFQFQSN